MPQILNFIQNCLKYFGKAKGFTFVQTLVGMVILMVMILGLYGMFQLGIKITAQNKARITATALANQRIETFRNLSYDQVGTIGGIPSGDVPETEIFTRNNIDFTVKTTINYIDDSFDGVAPEDDLPNDYKRVKVKVTWSGVIGGEIILITDIAPKGLEANEGGGNLLISVFNASGEPVGQADIHLVNTKADPAIDANYQTNDQGEFLVAGAPSSTNGYQITITKPGHSSERTYGTDEVANPNKPHATVLPGQLTQVSFSIDLLGGMTVGTLSPWGSDSFNDSFFSQDQVAEFYDVEIGGGEVVLATTTATSTTYQSSGNLISIPVIPDDILNWDELSWDDNQPIETQIQYQLYYATSTNWQLIPDNDLDGNGSGFTDSPIDLSGLSGGDYPKLKIKGELSTNHASTSPTLFSWRLSWITSEPTPIGDVSFNLTGRKTIGTDAQENSVYKFSQDFITNSQGEITISDLEWDIYDFEIDPAENLALISTEPESDPVGQGIGLLPSQEKTIDLFLEASNSLLFNISNAETLEPVFNAQIRLYDEDSYDQTLFSDLEGQAFFIPLESGMYSYEIQANDYENISGSLDLLGDEIINLNLTPIGPS